MASPPHPLPQSNQRLVLAAQLAFLPTGILTTLLGPMLPVLIPRWALSDAQAGDLFLVQFLASFAGVQISGFLLARAGFRPAFLSGLLLMACGVSVLYMGSMRLGVAALSLYGLGLGLIIPTDNLLIAEICPNSRAASVSLLNSFWGVGAVLCSLGMAWAQAHALVPFFLEAVALVLIVLIVAAWNQPFPALERPRASSAGLGWNTATVWFFAAVFFLYPGAETAVGGWIGSYVARMGAHGARLAALMPAVFWSALTVGRGSASLVLKHSSERRLLQAGFALGTMGIALLLWSRTPGGVIASALITGLSFSTLYPITIARFSHQFGVDARRAGAIMFSLASVGPAVVPWTVGAVSSVTDSLRAGLIVPLAATAVLLLIHLKEW